MARSQMMRVDMSFIEYVDLFRKQIGSEYSMDEPVVSRTEATRIIAKMLKSQPVKLEKKNKREDMTIWADIRIA